MGENELVSKAKDEVLRAIRGEGQDEFLTFDSEFSEEALSLAAHSARTYVKLHGILAGTGTARAPHWPIAATYLLDGTNSIVAAFTTLRSGFPIQALDLVRRVIETTCVAVYICDHPGVAFDSKLSRLPAGKCVSYARKHLPNVGRPYGTFSFFDHPHSAMLTPFLTRRTGAGPELAYPLGQTPIEERRSLFSFAALQLVAQAHNVEGVTEMLFFPGLQGEKRFWTPGAKGIEYHPVEEELRCERETAAALQRLGPTLALELGRTADSR